MRKTTAAALGGVAFIALVAGIWIGVRTWRAKLHTELPAAAVLPPDAFYYVEARNLRSQWNDMRSTKAWQDLQASDLTRSLREEGPIASLRSELDDLSKKVDYELSSENVLKFLGSEAAMALWMDEADELQRTIVGRIDTEALAADLLDGDVDWRALQEELNRRAERADVAIATSEYRGYSIATARKNDDVAYSTLLEDLLVLSTSEAGAKRAIDLRLAEGAGSLHERPVFRQEIEALPQNATLIDWIDVVALRERRQDIKAKLEVEQSLDPYFKAISAKAVARSIEIPEGDLYRAHWTWSRGQSEIFADNVSPRLRDVIPPSALVYVEAQRLGQLGEAWDRSSTKRHIEASWLAEKFQEILDDADETLREFRRFELPDEVGQAAGDEFAQQFGLHVLRTGAAATLGADAAIAFWIGEHDGAPRPELLIALRLDTDGRMMELAARFGLDTVARRQEHTELLRVTHGTREIRGMERTDDGSGGFWTQAGDVLLVGSNVRIVRAALDRIDAGDSADVNQVADVVAQFEPDYRVFGLLDVDAALAAARKFGGGDTEVEEMFDVLEDLTAAKRTAGAMYVEDDLSRIDFRWRNELRADIDPDTRGVLGNVAIAAPRAFDLLPERVIAVQDVRADLASAWRMYDRDDAGPLMQPLREGLRDLERELEIDIDGELLPALGPEFAFAFTLDTEPWSAEIPPIPGIALLMQVRDAGPVESLLRNSAAALEREAGEDAPVVIVREQFEDSTLVRVEFAEDTGVPLTPTFTVVEGFVVVLSDVKLLDQMIEVRDGVAPSLSRSALEARVRAAGVSPDGHEASRLDWNRMLDQVASYAPQIAQLMVDTSEIEYPDYPEQGGMEEWQRRMAKYEEQVRQASESKRDDAIGCVDSFRFIDFMAGSSRQSGETQEGVYVIRFVE